MSSSSPTKHYPPVPFDAEASAEFAKCVLACAKVKGALIGSVRTWFALPEEVQTQTKDIDFAMRQEDIVWVKQALDAMHVPFVPNHIGGIGVVVPSKHVKVDFVDRSSIPAVEALFREAVAAAETADDKVLLGTVEVLAVPIEYVIAMKLVPARDRDDRILEALFQYAEFDCARARDIVERHLGPVTVLRFDAFARRAGRLNQRD